MRDLTDSSMELLRRSLNDYIQRKFYDVRSTEALHQGCPGSARW